MGGAERFQLPSARLWCHPQGRLRVPHHTGRQHQATFRRRGAIPVYEHRYKRDGTVSVYGFRIPFTARPQAGLSSRHQAVLCYRRGSSSCTRWWRWTSPFPPGAGLPGLRLGTTNLLTDSERRSTADRRWKKKDGSTPTPPAPAEAGDAGSAAQAQASLRTQGRYQRDVNHGSPSACGQGATALLRHCPGRPPGIRDRIKARRRQRARLHNWAFGQLRQFIAYKAAKAGVPVVFVDPANTSRTCPVCGHVDKRNRRSQAEFCCRRCGHAGPADVIAARNIRAWARGDAPMVASARAATSPLPTPRG